jgi:peptidoglycan/LPS O-acetylase OafA/YrhL
LQPLPASLDATPGKQRTQPKGRSDSSYIPGLDGIRAIAFLMVFWAHALPSISYFIPATLGVTIFFFLSGYLITTLLRKEILRTGTIALGSFYIRRTLRIFIPLYIVYAAAVAVLHFYFHDPYGNLLGFCSMLFYFYNYANILGLHAWLPIGMNVIWSLAVEEHFYLLFPLVLLWMTRRRLSVATQTRILIAFCALELVWRVVLVAVLHDNRLWTYFATDARLDSILWGCILALRNNPVYIGKGSAPDRSILPARHQFLAFAGAVVLLAASLVPRSQLYKESLRYTVQALALYAIFSFIIPNIRHWSVRWLEFVPLRYIGWISYVLYLSHDFILTVVTRYYPDRGLRCGIIAFVISVAFATLIRYTVELPLQHLRARFRRVTEADPKAPDGHGLIA